MRQETACAQCIWFHGKQWHAAAWQSQCRFFFGKWLYWFPWNRHQADLDLDSPWPWLDQFWFHNWLATCRFLRRMQQSQKRNYQRQSLTRSMTMDHAYHGVRCTVRLDYEYTVTYIIYIIISHIIIIWYQIKCHSMSHVTCLSFIIIHNTT